MLFAPAGAQGSVGNDASPRLPRYAVELIVFRQLDQRLNTEESWDPVVPAGADPLPDDFDNPFEPAEADSPPVEPGPVGEPNPGGTGDDGLSTKPDSVPDDSAAEPPRPRIGFFLLDLHPRPPEFVLLPPGRLQLGPEYDRLEQLEAYQPLLHIGWEQTAHARPEAVPFRIPPSVVASSGIDGAVTLYKERFVHFDLDLTMTERPEPPAYNPDAVFSFLDDLLMPEPVRPPARVFRIEESRRIRGSQLQYFDHPRFGVIASIRPVEQQQPSAMDGQ